MHGAPGDRLMIYRLIVLSLGLALTGSTLSAPGNAGEILEQVIAAYGGEGNLRKLETMIQEWDMLALRGNRPGDDRRSIDFAGRLRVELTYPDRQETRILNGDAGIAIFQDEPPAVASDMQRDAMRLQLMRLYSPLALRERVDALGVSSTETTSCSRCASAGC